MPILDGVEKEMGWVGPEMNKFKQVSSDYHQMSLAGVTRGMGMSREPGALGVGMSNCQ